MCGKSRHPPGFDSRTVQPVASRYTGPLLEIILETTGIIVLESCLLLGSMANKNNVWGCRLDSFQNRVQLWAFLKTVMKFQVLHPKAGHYFTSRKPIKLCSADYRLPVMLPITSGAAFCNTAPAHCNCQLTLLAASGEYMYRCDDSSVPIHTAGCVLPCHSNVRSTKHS